MQLRGAWDGNNPRLLSQQSGKRDLGRGRLLSLGNAAEQNNQGLICLESLWSEARQGASEVGAVEARVFVDFAREEAPAQWAVRDKADAKLFEGQNYFLFRGSRPQRVFALEGSLRSDCTYPAYRNGLRQPPRPGDGSGRRSPANARFH